jgi:Terminase small subunit
LEKRSSEDSANTAEKPAPKPKKPRRILSDQANKPNGRRGAGVPDPSGSGMTLYQRRFVDAYLTCLDPVQAILSIGYTGKHPKKCASMLRKIPAVLNGIKVGILAMQERAKIDQDWVIERLKLIADANIQDFVTFDGDGNAIVDPMLMPRNKAFAIDSYELVQDKPKGGRRAGKKSEKGVGGQNQSGANENTGTLRQVRKMKIKLKDSLGALNKLGIYAGLFKDEGAPVGVVRFVLEGAPPPPQLSGPGDGAIDVTPVVVGEKSGG